MLNTLKLLLPALIPSWRFFEVVAASPRIEIAMVQGLQAKPNNWTEFRPKPKRVPFYAMVRRLFWNAYGNQSLFLVSCAERLMADPTEHSQREILKRIIADLETAPNGTPLPPYLQFRLVFVSRGAAGLDRCVRYVSPIYQVSNGAEQ